MTNCAFLGLGVMGYPMAGHLVAAGHNVTVWNRTSQKARQWAETYDGSAAGTIAEAVSGADFVLMCVGDDPDVYAVTEKAIPAMKPGAVLVDHTTASAECARKCNDRATTKGVGFVDAPISGGEVGAQTGKLTIMCGGAQNHYDAAEPIMAAYAKASRLMGSSGAGQMTKMINQICIAGTLQGLAEGVHFAQKAGLEMASVLEAIGKGAAQSWQMVSPSIGCAKTWVLRYERPSKSGRTCRSQKWSMGIIRKFRNWGETAGIRRACLSVYQKIKKPRPSCPLVPTITASHPQGDERFKSNEKTEFY